MGMAASAHSQATENLRVKYQKLKHGIQHLIQHSIQLQRCIQTTIVVCRNEVGGEGQGSRNRSF